MLSRPDEINALQGLEVFTFAADEHQQQEAQSGQPAASLSWAKATRDVIPKDPHIVDTSLAIMVCMG